MEEIQVYIQSLNVCDIQMLILFTSIIHET